MKRLERIDLLDRIGRKLQAKWSYSQIGDYLRAWEVDITKETSSINSKWVYSRELLADEPDEKLLGIAEELGIEHGYVAKTRVSTLDTKFWKPGYFRLFISHVSTYTRRVAQLQKLLLRYGMSGFVAHQDIEPTKEWLNEIEKALMSMDALAAVLTPDFKQSNWTDHEVGIAVGRDVLVVPIKKGLDPYGFIARYQGLRSEGLTIGQVANALFTAISSNPRTKGKYVDILVSLMLDSSKEDDTAHWLDLLEQFEKPPTPALERIQTNAQNNNIIVSNRVLVSRINKLLASNSVSEISIMSGEDNEFDDDIPF